MPWKQRIQSGRIPDHCDWPKIKEGFDYVQTQWALLLPTNEVETDLHSLTSCQMYDHIRDTYFPQITQTHK
jgi:hypothetical protein